MSTATEDQIGWKIVEEMSVTGAALLKPIFDAQGGRNGRLSIQTDPRFYRDARAIVEQALHFNQLAPKRKWSSGTTWKPTRRSKFTTRASKSPTAKAFTIFWSAIAPATCGHPKSIRPRP